MKYPFIAIVYLFAWCLLVPYLILERSVKIVVILIQIVWHFSFEADYFILNAYHFIIPMPVEPIHFEIDNLKDYFLLTNWKG